ncbi:hypothetical protein Tco_0403734 [Tanacetum coccineum]
MERKVDTLMKDAISLMGRSESIFRITTNEMYRPSSEPSRQEEFEHIVMNFILDQEEERPIHSGDVIDWEFLSRQNLDQALFNSISIDPFSGPQWGNHFRVNEPIYRELVREFFASFEFNASPCRVGLYSERQSRENATLSGLRNGDTGVRDKNLIYGGMLVTRIARSFGLLTNELRDALSIEPLPHVFKKKSLIAMGVNMELQRRSR